MTDIARGELDEKSNAAREVWGVVKLISAAFAGLYAADSFKPQGDTLAVIVGAVVFALAWIAVSLLGLAVRHPGAAAKAVGWCMLCALGAWALESGLEAMSVKTLLAVI